MSSSLYDRDTNLMFGEINDNLSKIVNQYPAHKFIIFPFKECGFLTKLILNNKYGITEVAAIDNESSDYKAEIFRKWGAMKSFL